MASIRDSENNVYDISRLTASTINCVSYAEDQILTAELKALVLKNLGLSSSSSSTPSPVPIDSLNEDLKTLAAELKQAEDELKENSELLAQLQDDLAENYLKQLNLDIILNNNSEVIANLNAELATKPSADSITQAILDAAAGLSGQDIVPLYQGTEKDASGEVIAFWISSKQDPTDPQAVVWKQDSSSFRVSTDGGLTWNAGISVDGSVIAQKVFTNELWTEKLNAIEASFTNLLVDHLGADVIAANQIHADHIVGGTLDCGQMTVKNINAGSITTGLMSGDRIIANTINGNKIIANTITGDHIQANSISVDKIKANLVTTDMLNAHTITADKIVSGTLDANRIGDASIGADKMVANFIDAFEINANKITSGTISADRIDFSQLHSLNKMGLISINLSTSSNPTHTDMTADGIRIHQYGEARNWTGVEETKKGFYLNTISRHNPSYLTERTIAKLEIDSDQIDDEIFYKCGLRMYENSPSTDDEVNTIRITNDGNIKVTGNIRAASVGTANNLVPQIYATTIGGNTSSTKVANLYVNKINGNTYGGSDRRIKKNIKKLPESTAKDLITNLRPVSFKYKEGDDDKIRLGFIALDVQQIIPETWGLVGKESDEQDAKLYLSYTELIAPLVSLVQLLQKEIDELKELIKSLA